jgi:nucleoside-diphosphate kinase
MSATQTAHAIAPRSERFKDLQKTLVLVKPDAVTRGLIGNILNRFENRGLAIKGMKLIQMDAGLAGQLYSPHEGKPFYNDLVEYMTSGPIVCLCLEGVNAIPIVRTMMGATNPKEAAPGTIRGDFAQRMDCNCVHGSDSPESASRELPIFFGDGEILDYDPCHTHRL